MELGRQSAISPQFSVDTTAQYNFLDFFWKSHFFSCSGAFGKGGHGFTGWNGSGAWACRHQMTFRLWRMAYFARRKGPARLSSLGGGEAAASSSPTLNGASFGSTLLSIECGHDYMGVSCGSSNGVRTTTGGGDRRTTANGGPHPGRLLSASCTQVALGKLSLLGSLLFFYNWYEYVSIWLLLSGGLDTQRTATWELVPGWRGKALLQRTAFFRPTCCFAVEG